MRDSISKVMLLLILCGVSLAVISGCTYHEHYYPEAPASSVMQSK